MTALLLFWILLIASFVSYRSDSLTAYASKLGFGRPQTETLQPNLGESSNRASNIIPTTWLKNTIYLKGEESALTRLDNRLSIKPTNDVKNTHNEIFSRITPYGSFFNIDFGQGNRGLNPNIIPHPYNANIWIIVAQEFHGSPGDSDPVTPWSVEMVCNANFNQNGTLHCIKSPSILPIAATPISPKCPQDLEVINLNVGPHDARVFYGPSIPYTTFGSQSQYSCLGQFIQDFRYLIDWGMFRTTADLFFMATDIEKPNAGPMEKNFFIFWDLEGSLYANYDLHPKRIFSKINADGTASTDLAPQAQNDAQCWQNHLELNPLPTEIRSSIHQATNSLAITMCARSDPLCQATSDNTFIFHIYQHKIYTSMFHSRYEPFVVLFKPTAPFDMYAITSKPFWIHGRQGIEQMLYITSLSWSTHGQTYQGHIDDTLFITFGIDDNDTGAIDVTAEELLRDLMFC